MNDIGLTTESLPEQIQGLIGPISQVEVAPEGVTSDVAIITGARGTFVVKRSDEPPFTKWLRREYEVLQALEASNLLTPRPFLYLEEPPAHWLVMERLPGISLSARLSHVHDDGVRRRLLFGFGELLGRVHREPVPESLIGTRPWLDTMLDIAAAYLAQYEVDGTPALLDQLRTHRPSPVPTTLIHGDYTLENVLVDGDRVAGIVDWCWGADGDPRCDLAIATGDTDAFREPGDVDAFYAGYGGKRLTDDERSYFEGLYEFF